MSRCKACNIKLTDSDYFFFHRNKEFDLELCSHCRFISDNPNLCKTHEYQFEFITEQPFYQEIFENRVDR